MTATTHSEFNDNTEALEVAKAFSENIVGKTILITGVNINGIGYTATEAFASESPSCLILAGRSLSRIQDCIDALKKDYPKVTYRPLLLDLSSQKAVRKAAAEVLSWEDVPAINILVNSAAMANIPERTLSEDGIEMQFATNHIGHFLFTCLIMPKLLKAAEGGPKSATRIVNVTSLSPSSARMRWSDTNFDTINKDLPEDEQPNYNMHRAWGAVDPENKAYVPIEGYNQSKVANVLFSVALNDHLNEKHGILSLALHPGVIRTELGRYSAEETKTAIQEMFKKGVYTYKTIGAGSSTTLVAATDPALDMPKTRSEDGYENYGVFLADCQISDKALPVNVTSKNGERLWKMSEELVKERFSW